MRGQRLAFRLLSETDMAIRRTKRTLWKNRRLLEKKLYRSIQFNQVQYQAESAQGNRAESAPLPTWWDPPAARHYRLLWAPDLVLSSPTTHQHKTKETVAFGQTQVQRATASLRTPRFNETNFFPVSPSPIIAPRSHWNNNRCGKHEQSITTPYQAHPTRSTSKSKKSKIPNEVFFGKRPHRVTAIDKTLVP